MRNEAPRCPRSQAIAHFAVDPHTPNPWLPSRTPSRSGMRNVIFGPVSWNLPRQLCLRSQGREPITAHRSRGCTCGARGPPTVRTYPHRVGAERRASVSSEVKSLMFARDPVTLERDMAACDSLTASGPFLARLMRALVGSKPGRTPCDRGIERDRPPPAHGE